MVDAVAYGPQDARQLLTLQRSLGAIVVISSASVYSDGAGRTLDEAAETGFPRLPDPISERQSTVEPGHQTYSTRKVALERTLLERAAVPVTVLRPGAISGQGSQHAREWWFVKRVLDRRRRIPLAYRGLSRFHTASVENIAELIRTAAPLAGQQILNIADPVAPTVAEIGCLIAQHLGFAGEIVLLPDINSYPPPVGRTPWSVQFPFVLDTTAATAVGYRPRTRYAETVPAICDWLVNSITNENWRSLIPVLASYPFDLFDYELEDKLSRA
ncbi:MAG: reductase [Methylobacteriaceae bacterium]|nr:reductase [Methylobacteriaceae bacterium]